MAAALNGQLTGTLALDLAAVHMSSVQTGPDGWQKVEVRLSFAGARYMRAAIITQRCKAGPLLPVVTEGCKAGPQLSTNNWK